ncbi:MAG: hypothetical protein J6Q21_04120 [Alistipes sp.]|nr:hypothetical protein [Alistipes sp.]
MKKFNWLMMLMTAATLSFAACTEPTPEVPVGPDDPTPEGLTFKVELGEVTYSSVDYTVTPSDLEAEYLCILYDAATVEEFTQDKYLVATLLQELEAEARTEGMTLVEFLADYTDKGVLEGSYERLAPESDYYIIVFGVDPANNYEACSEVNKTKFTTLAFEKLDVTFEVETTVDGNTAEFKVTPSDNEVIWYFYTIPTGSFDYYQSPDAYNMSLDQFFLYCLEQQINQLRGAGYDDNTILNALFHKGALTLQAKDLTANTEYTNMVAGFVIDESGVITLASDVATSTYVTGEAKAADLTFELSVTDVEMDRAAIKITPSDDKATFCWMVGAWDGAKTAEEIMNEIVAMYGGWMNSGMMLYTGVQDYTGGPGSPYKYKLDAPDTDYYVVAFGYAGGITTAPVMETFHTLPAPEASETEFNMTASAVTPYSLTIGITSSVASTYYTPGVCAPSEYNEEILVAEVEAGIAEILAMQQAQDPNVTLAQVLGMYFYKGNYTIDASGMQPETTIMGYIFAIDHKTGKIAKVQTFENLATTTKPGDVTPTVEFIGNYSGNEENGAAFGKPEATKGKAISVFKYTNLDGARSLFTTLLGDNLMNYTDPELWKLGTGDWATCSMTQPYGFYVTDWDYEYTALAYAVDATTGQPGGIGREKTMPTVENKQDIQELIDLVTELNAAEKTSFTMPQSIVVSEGIKLEAVKVEAEAVVEAPAAEIMAAPAIENNVVKVGGYIRPFYM